MTDTIEYDVRRPQGALARWEACSVARASAETYLARYPIPESFGPPLRCVLWSEPETDRTRVIAAEYEGGRRAVIRFRGSGYKITFERWS